MRSKLNPAKEVADWNARVKVGDTVEYAEVIGLTASKQYKTSTAAEVLSGHTAVVWLEGKSGCVCVSHCTPVPA
jgi:hypothetical protein